MIKQWKVPWQIVEQVEEIQQLQHGIQTDFRHIFREANQFADKLANTTIDQKQHMLIQSFQQLPTQSKGILNMDKAQIASSRIKTRKINIIQHELT